MSGDMFSCFFPVHIKVAYTTFFLRLEIERLVLELVNIIPALN